MAIGWLWSTHRRCWNIEAKTQMLKHKCWNKNVGTQMLKHSAEIELEHRSWRRWSMLSLMAIGWLWSTHRRCWNIEARTQMLKHECWNTNAGSQMQKHNAEIELELMLKHSVVIVETQ
jgi:hypothetical protein